MDELLLWIYLLNAVLLITHEIDSAYWKEWELFKLKGGATGFLLIHFPLLFLVMYGAVSVSRAGDFGYLISGLLGLSGIFAFGIHSYFLSRGHPQFRTLISRAILWAILPMSVLQLVITLLAWTG